MNRTNHSLTHSEVVLLADELRKMTQFLLVAN